MIFVVLILGFATLLTIDRMWFGYLEVKYPRRKRGKQ